MTHTEKFARLTAHSAFYQATGAKIPLNMIRLKSFDEELTSIIFSIGSWSYIYESDHEEERMTQYDLEECSEHKKVWRL
jgi:hypothetical protein